VFLFLACVTCSLMASPVPSTASRVIVVTGATGRSGSIIYSNLKATQGIEVRALVTNVTKAKGVLNCSKCDASEGIFVGDVSDLKSLTAVMAGATDLAIAVGLGPGATTSDMEKVEWKGVEMQVTALAQGRPSGMAVADLRVALISSMGTTNPKPPAYEGGEDLFYKLQAEAFLMSAGVGFAIVKPCGLGEGPAGQHELTTGHDDTKGLGILYHSIDRADVAAVMVQALLDRTTGLRMDLCSRPGKAPDLKTLLASAGWPWQQSEL